jgi:hypothetical protein
MSGTNTMTVIPAKAGIHANVGRDSWIPAFAGTTVHKLVTVHDAVTVHEVVTVHDAVTVHEVATVHDAVTVHEVRRFMR